MRYDVGCERGWPVSWSADGRNSTVRKQAGITPERQEAISYISGLLLAGLDGAREFDVLAGEGDVFFLVFHQGGGRFVVHLWWAVEPALLLRPRGDEALPGVAVESYPERGRAATAGPCATIRAMTRGRRALCRRVVLIGDAAGHNDPSSARACRSGCGAHRARPGADGARDASAFAPRGERMERMRRLRLIADVIAMIRPRTATARREEVFGEDGLDGSVLPAPHRGAQGHPDYW